MNPILYSGNTQRISTFRQHGAPRAKWLHNFKLRILRYLIAYSAIQVLCACVFLASSMSMNASACSPSVVDRLHMQRSELQYWEMKIILCMCIYIYWAFLLCVVCCLSVIFECLCVIVFYFRKCNLLINVLLNRRNILTIIILTFFINHSMCAERNISI